MLPVYIIPRRTTFAKVRQLSKCSILARLCNLQSILDDQSTNINNLGEYDVYQERYTSPEVELLFHCAASFFLFLHGVHMYSKHYVSALIYLLHLTDLVRYPIFSHIATRRQK